jgi:hypothetical protein
VGGDTRLIAPERQAVEVTDAAVSLSASQLPDGSLLNDGRDYPTVRLDQRSGFFPDDPDAWADGFELTADGARRLARALVLAAEQLDVWTGVCPPSGKPVLRIKTAKEQP